MGTQARTPSRQARQAREAREARQARAEAQRRTRRRHRNLGVAGGVVIVALLAAIAFVLVDAAGGDDPPAPPAAQSTAAPAGATATGAIVTGTGPVTVTIYLDYLCPYCGRFERANSGDLERLVAAGTVRLELHPLAFLDRASQGTRYSTRTANAVATVADRSPAKVLAFNAALFEQQPAEGGPGLTDQRIAAIATGAGVPADVAASFTERRFERWVATSTDWAFQHGGVTGTPTVLVNGKVFEGDLYTAGPLAAAVAAAA
ncbi:thioredoxin domain-containing protein [Dactylosporangium sp. NPDC049742]|uniref:DsbA family protein n=1 Tax=Dactylosporangium sp. NPDC049742 TaxID=3154737 RepID=UPI00342F3E88